MSSSSPTTLEKNEGIELDDLDDPLKASESQPSSPPAYDLGKVPRWKPHVQFATLFFALYLAGWNDGTTGPLLPRIQEFYHVSSSP